MSHFAPLGKHGLLLEAEVAPKSQATFEKRYFAASKHAISPGTPKHYQPQKNKWGAELRVYFNDPGMAVSLAAMGMNVERRKSGYLTEKFQFRVSNNKLWWSLVENYGLRLGPS